MQAGFSDVSNRLDAGFSAVTSHLDAGLADVSNHVDAASRRTQEGLAALSMQMQAGLSAVARNIGVMNADMNFGFARLEYTVRESSEAICEKLDAMNDILKNPRLTQARELYRLALANYTRGFYEEALKNLLKALEMNETDVVSCFLLGKTYLCGQGVFSDVGETVDVIDVDASIGAFRKAAKYIKPDVNALWDGHKLAAEIWFYLGLAQQTKSGILANSHDIEASQDYVRQAMESFGKSWNYSPDMLESLYNHARCRVFLGDVTGALHDLEQVILKDRWYCIKTAADPDFDAIKDEFHALVQGMKKDAYPEAKAAFDHIRTLKAQLPVSPSPELARLLNALPDSFTEDLPYLDMMEAIDLFPEITEMLEKERRRAEEEAEEAEEEREFIILTFGIINNVVTKYRGPDKNVIIPEGVTSIGREAFYGNHLTSVVIPEGVTSIGGKAFAENQLTSVVIPEGVTSIGREAFYGNYLTSVVIPEGVTSIGGEAFAENQLTSVVIPKSVASIGEGAFYGNHLTSVVISESVTSIGDRAFSCNHLTSIVIPEGVTSIGNFAFSCNHLTSIVIPEGVTSIGGKAFAKNQLTSIVIPKGVISIGEKAFSNNQLTSVVIPEGVTSIGKEAFYGNKLTSVVITKGVTHIGENAFGPNAPRIVYK
jgi:tetratricopeptide (TPR) repeat protein